MFLIDKALILDTDSIPRIPLAIAIAPLFLILLHPRSNTYNPELTFNPSLKISDPSTPNSFAYKIKWDNELLLVTIAFKICDSPTPKCILHKLNVYKVILVLRGFIINLYKFFVTFPYLIVNYYKFLLYYIIYAAIFANPSTLFKLRVVKS